MTVVLVVDDEPALLLLAADVLEEAGFEVLTASDGSQALDVVGSQPLDLILLDMRMPVIDGAEFARLYYEQFGGSCAPIVVFTAGSDAEASARRVGAQGYISKPFDIDELVDVVRRHAIP